MKFIIKFIYYQLDIAISELPKPNIDLQKSKCYQKISKKFHLMKSLKKCHLKKPLKENELLKGCYSENF